MLILSSWGHLQDAAFPVRQLAVELSINPNTIQRAYMNWAAGADLSGEGKGSFVRQQQDQADRYGRNLK